MSFTSPTCSDDFRSLARRRLPRLLFDYIDGGSYAERTLARNIADLQTITLRQRVLRNVSSVSLATQVMGQALTMPIILGPVGLAGMYARRGEVAAARAARSLGIPFCLSTSSICAIEEVRERSAAPFWFQLYMLKDRAFMLRLLERATRAGCPVLVFTIDLAVPGARYRDVRSGFNAPPSVQSRLRRAWAALTHPAWTADVYLRGRPHELGNLVEAMTGSSLKRDFWAWVRKNWDSGVTWNDIEWVRQHWPGPIVLKGILDTDDAREAVRAGVDAIIVSNHGGRQLDSSLSSACALPSIVDAVGNRLPVLVDGGIRSGLDVLKMMAMGAKACLIGRAWAYALAARGEAGVHSMLTIMRAELEVAMALTGCTDIRNADAQLLDPRA
jgi:L-lactate dehydrogenase (cytochrome)